MHEVGQYVVVTIFLFKILNLFLFIMFMRVMRVYVGYLLLRVYIGYLLLRVYVGYLRVCRVFTLRDVKYLRVCRVFTLMVYVGYLL